MNESNSTARKVELIFASRRSDDENGEIAIASIEDLEALAAKYEVPLIITVGKDGKLSSVEGYDDYRE